jgi:hypothetical protein
MQLLSIMFLSLLNPQDSLWQQAYDSSDFVGLVKIHKEDSYASLEIIKVWKSNFTHDIYLSADMCATLDDLGEYLIFRSKDNIRPIKKAEISREMLTFLEHQPCVDPKETLAEKIRNGLLPTGGCLRGPGFTICGCNGETYGSPCESHNDGVMKYTAGPCPKK